jgi:hypothetical protein
MSRQQTEEKDRSSYKRKANCCEICIHCDKPAKMFRTCGLSATGFLVDSDGICNDFELIEQLKDEKRSK